MTASTLEVKSRKPEALVTKDFFINRSILDTAFKQQRLRAWQPILTPRTVLPTLFLIGVLFAPLGGILLYVSNSVSEVVIDYTECYKAGESYVPITSGLSKISFPGSSVITDPNQFQYKITQSYLSGPYPPNTEGLKCTIKFNIPDDIPKTVYLYYQLTNFYQNHRRYVKSVSYSQLAGQAVPASSLSTDCDPLASDPKSGKPYYPCGLIANSVFNDTISSFKLKDSDLSITFSEPGIAWDSDAQKFKKTAYSYNDVVPPPNWAKRFPGGVYTESLPPPDLSADEHLQVWMRTAGLPSFRKLYGRYDQNFPKGTYEVDIDWNFNTTLYKGQKLLVLSTVSFLGGKNPYLGYAYLSLGALCVLLGLIFTIRHMLYPRKLGDSSYLSWNQTRATGSGSAAPAASVSSNPSNQTLSD